MKEFIEKLIGRLEEEKQACHINAEFYTERKIGKIIEIVNQLAEEYNNDFCEWKQILGNTYIAPTCIEGKYFEYTDMQFCPYCGKEIKILD